MRRHAQALLDAITDLLFEVGFDGRVYDFHSSKAELLALSAESFVGKLLAEVLPAETAAICMGAIEEASRLGRSSGAIYSLELPGGRRWFEISVSALPLNPEADWDQRFVFLSRDVSFRMQAAVEVRGVEVPLTAHQGLLDGAARHSIEEILKQAERATCHNDLRHALERQEFHLVLQPQVRRDGTLTGAEALLRWIHPVRGNVPPAEFIPLAEETGLILQIGAWVIEAACWQLAAWAGQAGLRDLKIAVNVSALQFQQEDFVAQTQAILARTGARADRLKMELTESLMLRNVESTIEKMRVLRKAGVCFSLDDFGTGFSSLSYLKRLPLGQLKIDQSFVHNILSDANDAAICKMVIALGKSLGLEVIAEGVESEAQHAALAALGCHAFQGYLFGRPMPIPDFEDRAGLGHTQRQPDSWAQAANLA